MDFPVAPGLIPPMPLSLSRTLFWVEPSRWKTSLPGAAALLFLLTGCTSPLGPVRAGQTGAVATIKVFVPSPVETSAANEVPCQIQSIDGVAAGAADSLSPGKHRLIIILTSLGKSYVGDADLIIPEAKNYRLKAERKDEAFTLSLIEVDSSRTVATSTAPVNPQMKFVVFVIQK